MVLWEIAVATAYFLGLKRTYKHALRIQRRLIGPNHPNIRQFLHSPGTSINEGHGGCSFVFRKHATRNKTLGEFLRVVSTSTSPHVAG